ncbi:GNAT family N-acetyltransferase [Pedobacter ginsengisoli]|uniref:GNAT family N-acetyltransferase n=1 Tax=Pedobacter ginsengisoli TaxID=363852 RepID=A0A2D1U792_9SPHI|nr:GNAT family N-acetyltransferase [Pedobacter ginsengisoli]ATP57475.1 GNAT family N-acetyltransferase [Pedobacter ginsengisoli]
MAFKEKIKLRTAITADIASITQLYTETVLTVCTGEYNQNELETWASLGQNLERWKDRIKNQYFLIAELGEKIVGFASLSHEGYLDVFYIHKDYQRRGIAFTLYNTLEEQAIRLSLKNIIADVSKTAKPFFEKQGFLTLREQLNHLKGYILVNYKMEKKI